MGATAWLAVSCCSRIRPTWGPLPWVTTTSHPSSEIPATTSEANRADRRMASAESSAPRCRRALPPRAMTTRPATGLPGVQDGAKGFLQGRRALRLLEVVEHSVRRRLDAHQLSKVDGRGDQHGVGSRGVDHPFELPELIR